MAFVAVNQLFTWARPVFCRRAACTSAVLFLGFNWCLSSRQRYSCSFPQLSEMQWDFDSCCLWVKMVPHSNSIDVWYNPIVSFYLNYPQYICAVLTPKWKKLTSVVPCIYFPQFVCSVWPLHNFNCKFFFFLYLEFHILLRKDPHSRIIRLKKPPILVPKFTFSFFIIFYAYEIFLV